ncbi:helix-turn-helix transcriptional regulator [Pseudomonas kuykendallii]|uniref:helix-turn-helix transcriptional regulator n=1 Tax=Pseudomonas kuykendallii TaxID=1007099 RepID=UPI0028D69F8C|nr:helix-turn-helix transcriptional regulator [Pseudomonas kuykendallii]
MNEVHPSVLTLKRYFGEKRRTVSGLAEQFHVTPATITQILNGRVRPSAELAGKITALLEERAAPPAPTAQLKCPFMNSTTVRWAVRFKRSGCRILEAIVGALLIYLLGLNR